MATLTVRNLGEPLETWLKMRAAARNHSMQEEVRQILQAALQQSAMETLDLVSRIRARLDTLEDVRLSIEPRQAVREPPALDASWQAGATGKRKAGERRR